jgi:branched-chain amino acid aminotransferase
MRYHVNGDLVPAEDAAVSVRDRGFMYGDAAFETLRAYRGSVFAWAAHERRLRRTCEILGFAEAVPDDLRERVAETLAANDLREAYVRLSVTRGVQPGKLTPADEVDPSVVVVVAELPEGGPGGTPVWDGPAVAETVDVQRVPDAALPARAKTHNYLNGILARLDLSATADEALMCDADGNLAEGAASNVFLLDGDGLRTPALDGPVLPGVTRRTVLDLARDEGLPVREERVSPAALRTADEAFLTNTTWEVRPLARVDGVAVGGGPVTDLLARRYRDRVAEECGCGGGSGNGNGGGRSTGGDGE